MTRRSRILLLAALPLLGGCQASRFFAYLVFGGHEREVKAEFTDLAGKRLVVVIYCDRSVQYEHPNVTLTLSSVVGEELRKNVKKVEVVDPRRVIKYQDGNIHWEEMDKTELGKAFGADYVLFLSLVKYSTREPGSMNLYRGRIAAEVSVYKASLPERQSRVWHGRDVQVIHPEHAPAGVLRESDRMIRDKTEHVFAEELAKRFYDHKVPIE